MSKLSVEHYLFRRLATIQPSLKLSYTLCTREFPIVQYVFAAIRTLNGGKYRFRRFDLLFPFFFFFLHFLRKRGSYFSPLHRRTPTFNIIVGERYNKFSHAKNSASSQGFHVHPYRYQIKFLVYRGNFLYLNIYRYIGATTRNNVTSGRHIGNF